MKDDFDLIARMRELHLPDPVGWWPPAPGWWALAVVVLIAAGVVWGFWHRRGALRRAALSELRRIREEYQENNDTRRLMSELSVLLRRLALGRSPRSQAAGLTGEAWLHYLDEAAGDDIFAVGEGRLFASSPYRAGGVPPGTADRVIDLVEHWIRRVV